MRKGPLNSNNYFRYFHYIDSAVFRTFFFFYLSSPIPIISFARFFKIFQELQLIYIKDNARFKDEICVQSLRAE